MIRWSSARTATDARAESVTERAIIGYMSNAMDDCQRVSVKSSEDEQATHHASPEGEEKDVAGLASATRRASRCDWEYARDGKDDDRNVVEERVDGQSSKQIASGAHRAS